jgi:uncharacterized membrane protein YuzA (DUF378 family)
MPFNNQETINILQQLLTNSKDIILGALGGLVAYLLDYITAQRKKDNGENVMFVFRYTSLFINMILGAFVAHIVGSALSEDFSRYRDAIIGLSGVTAYQILILAESRFAKYIVDKFTKKD